MEKVCPFLLARYGIVFGHQYPDRVDGRKCRCVKESCEFWSAPREKCAIIMQAEALDFLAAKKAGL